MKTIYLVMSEELLDHEEWEKSPCRAFATKTEAEDFKKVLQELHRENKHYEPVTRFYIQSLDFGQVEKEYTCPKFEPAEEHYED